MQEERYSVKLEDIFEGPMDLLIHLIRKNEIDIYDIPIAMITRQYLEYLDWLKFMNIDFAGEFIVMAATLTQIKSRMLLPTHGYEDEDIDPRSEITKPLLEYLRMKSMAEELSKRHLLGDSTFVRTPDLKEYLSDTDDRFVKIGLFELIDAFQKILENLPGDHKIDFSTDRISVKDRITEIIDVLEAKGSVTFTELFPATSTKSDIIVTFLAILEMVKLYLIRIVQHSQTGIIRLFYL
ncbi:MAG: segregation/condensation protein A [Desulfobacterales bacterium]|nr:segregation/condensation protein A [Desulfobacterales bacterium]